MDEFFQKYGWLIVAGVIIVIMIGMASPVGEAIKEKILGFVTNFASKVTF